MVAWRLMDTGRSSAAENIALDEVLLNSRAGGHSVNTVRFLGFGRPAVLVGYNQSIAQEVRTDYCASGGIEINRRITGGGAIYFDESQIGWEIICDRAFFGMKAHHAGLFEKACEPVILALAGMGIRAAFRPRNDIEVNGRKISGTGGTESGDAVLFQGTLLVDFDVRGMLSALRVPVEKLRRRELMSAGERVTCLKRELGKLPDHETILEHIRRGFETSFGISFERGGLSETERAMLREALPRFSSEAWINKVKLPEREQGTVHSVHRADGGALRAASVINIRQKRIRSTLITGDFFSFPRRAVLDLEAGLKDIRADIRAIEERVRGFFDSREDPMPGIGPDDIIKLMGGCLDKAGYERFGLPPTMANRVNTVGGTLDDVLRRRPGHLLLPYCAKSTECGWRHREGCAECGECSVGDARGLGEGSGMEVITIQSFEHLMATLARLRGSGATSYIGCCCEAFYLKHLGDLRGAGIPGILLDIDSQTCYDLGKEPDAYLGRFDNVTNLDLDLLRRVLDARV